MIGGFLRLALDLLIDLPEKVWKEDVISGKISLAQQEANINAIQAKFGILYNMQKVHWLYYCEALLIITIVLLVVISLLTKAPDPNNDEIYLVWLNA